MPNNNGTFYHNGPLKVPKDFCFPIGKTEQRTLAFSGSIDIFYQHCFMFLLPQDCCCLSALQCYRDNLNKQFKATQKSQKILYRSLRNPLTVSTWFGVGIKP